MILLYDFTIVELLKAEKILRNFDEFETFDRIIDERQMQDIRTFCQSSCFYVNDLDSLVSTSNNWTRKKIAYILDTKVLETNSIDFILQDAKELGLQFQTNGENKIIFPEDLKAQKELLSYLADEIYRGSLTEDVYLTNSKRALK